MTGGARRGPWCHGDAGGAQVLIRCARLLWTHMEIGYLRVSTGDRKAVA